MATHDEVDLTTPFLDIPSGSSDDVPKNDSTTKKVRFRLAPEDERPSSKAAKHWLWDQALPIAFFPLIALQFFILVQYNNHILCPVPVLFSVGVFIFTATMYRQILSESQLEEWLVLALLPELSVFVTVAVATVTVNALMAYQTLLVSTLLVAVSAAWMTLAQIWKIYCSEDDEPHQQCHNQDEGNSRIEYHALVFDSSQDDAGRC